MIPNTYIWLGFMIFFAIMEAATVSLVSLWFVGGSFVAFLAALFHAPMWLQILLFLVVSAALLACLRPFVRKFVHAKKQPTNLDSIVGKAAPVTEDICNLEGRGAVKVDGKEWSARSEDGTPIEKGAVVTIVKIEGVKVIVRR